MGMERWYVAVVDGGRLLERALADPEFGEWLQVPSNFGRERRRPNRGGFDPEFMKFRAEVDAMNRLHPGIEDRIYTLDRYYDMLNYLLSEGRRRGELYGDDWGTKAIRGATDLPEHLRGGQGHPTRYSPPAEVREIADRLGGLTVEDLRAAYSPGGMEEQGVYKFQAAWADERTWAWIGRYYEGLRSFYAEVSSHGEGVLVVVT